MTDVKMGVNSRAEQGALPRARAGGVEDPADRELLDVEEVKGGVQLTVGGVIEREGSDKPVCVLESLSRLFG